MSPEEKPAEPAPSPDGKARPPTPKHHYETRRWQLTLVVADLERRSGRLSTLRLITFLAAAVVGGYALFRPLPQLGWVVFSVFCTIFVALVIAHALLITRKNELEQRAALITRGLSRLAGDATSSAPGARFEVPDHAYSGDLDLFGPASLFQLVSVAHTGPGEATLARWLSTAADVDAVHARQTAARELALLHGFREDLGFLGLRAVERGWSGSAAPALKTKPFKAESKGGSDKSKPAGDPPAPSTAGEDAAEGLLSWVEGPPILDDRGRKLVVARWILVPLTLTIIVAAQILGAERLGLWRHLWLVTLLAQITVLVAMRSSMEAALAKVASREVPFGKYRGMLERVEAEDFRAPLLADLRRRIAGESGHDASHAMGSLQKIIGYADLRHNGIIHLIANAVLLWDVWCGVALHRWRARFGGRAGRARDWIEALGEIEALSSVATFAFERPDFTWPEVSAGEPHFEAVGLGHPLIPAMKRVVNDVTLERGGRALLVTGSNMSGKSTLLRAIGVNAVLALAGAPVCADRLRLSTLSVRTSMRIKDSLEHGVSHFYAELERLKGVVDKVGQDPHVLFLLDEVLHGTNSRERIIGARAILLHLVDRGAIGLASSHDLGLVDLEQASNGRVVNVHLEELVENGRMTFDYKLKPGPVTTANALRLMKLVGIAVDLPET